MSGAIQQEAPIAETKIETLGGFLNCIRNMRSNTWRLEDKKELWFRGESKDFRNTRLRPELYRPRKGSDVTRSVDQILDIEEELYEEFRRCAHQFRAETFDH